MAASQSLSTTNEDRIRIGIVGGGIAGVSVAHALGQRAYCRDACEITILEADESAERGTGQWVAATARNANSMVPGVAMHVFSKKSVLFQVLKDEARQWYLRCYHQWFTLMQQRPQTRTLVTQRASVDPIQDFGTPPPYFGLHLTRCLGPSATSAERWSFVQYVKQYLYACLWLGDDAAHYRGERMCQLAQANRVAYNKAVAAQPSLRSGQGLTSGFLSCFRSLESARAAVLETQHSGEEAELLEWSDALSKEPHLENIPIRPLHVVWRPNDHVASCEKFIHHWIQESRSMGAQYRTANIDRVESVPSLGPESSAPHFRVIEKDGTTQEFDLLILAAGANTPLLANQLGVARYCPTYPLRGYSLTVQAPKHKQAMNGNLLRQPFTVDSMYCTSISSSMARFAGYGEFVGYRDKATSVPSMAPPVLARYAKAVLGKDFEIDEADSKQCFRPISPDDLPLVGEVPALPGLFLHTGHGTLGWTTSLSTGECLAQAVVDRLEGRGTQDGVFVLANQSSIERRALSPARFTNFR